MFKQLFSKVCVFFEAGRGGRAELLPHRDQTDGGEIHRDPGVHREGTETSSHDFICLKFIYMIPFFVQLMCTSLICNQWVKLSDITNTCFTFKSARCNFFTGFQTKRELKKQ